MNKNTIIGFILIFAVLIGYSYLNRPSSEPIDASQESHNSIEIVSQQATSDNLSIAESEQNGISAVTEEKSDSVKYKELIDRYGNFGISVEGTEEFVTLENNKMEIKLTSKGGRIYSVRLKDFTNYNDEPLYLFEGDETDFSLAFITANNRVLSSGDFYFDIISDSELQATLRLKAGENKSIDFVYTLHPDDYMVDFDVIPNNLQSELSPAMRTLDVQWMQKIRQQEKGRKFEERYTRLTYKFTADDVEQLGESKDDMKNITNKLKWIGYKDQFFSSVFISEDSFESSKLESRYFTAGKYMKEYSAYTAVPFINADNKATRFHYYFGPNDYTLLKNYDKTKFENQDLELEKLVPLGWSLFRAVNKWLIIPVFDWLTGLGISIGIAILLLTIIIKTALFPLTYKSFISSAKMRVLKPQIEEITKKYPGQDNAMTRQQKTMELYRQVGVSPMAGCLPMLLQMPFLLALFMFFPAAIELRQQSFLWAADLSTYDSLIHWNTYIPIVSKYFGNHISIFCLLMSLVTILNTKYTMDQQNTGQEQMPGMKGMMYFMPVMMFFILNSYPAGLNYYYLVSTLFTIIQTLGFRMLLNEEKLLAKLEANKGKAKLKKKSGFMARLEEAQRRQQALLKEQQKKNSAGKGKRR
ncbi:MAG: membrane protein insertase YidC [Dysgonamonadaceae bacterium]|jgi:YidC/Oxa1 family membrane protein insertase|nr:membrane protein insertase YidC [Dysgonamonadaceae bacterium]